MGGSSSKPTSNEKEQLSNWSDRIKASIQDEIFIRMMMQREVQMAINIAKARDNLQIFGSLWLTLVTGVSVAHLVGKKAPPLVAVPVVVGGVVLGNLADMAYGNKLQRVTREAEYLLEYEKPRFVPLKQASFAKFYSQQDKAAMLDQASAVGELWPSSMFSRPSSK